LLAKIDRRHIDIFDTALKLFITLVLFIAPRYSRTYTRAHTQTRARSQKGNNDGFESCSSIEIRFIGDASFHNYHESRLLMFARGHNEALNYRNRFVMRSKI